MTFNFLHLRSFYAVASERSVSQAARRLNISQPTISKQLRELESRHKVKLIEGTRPPLVLTSAGRLLFEKARVLFGVADEIGALLGQTDIEEGATLRLGADSPPIAAEFMSAFLDDVPGLNFRVSIANSGQTHDLLMRGQIDVGIICEPPIEAAYSYVPIYKDRLVAVLPASWHQEGVGAFPLDRIPLETMIVREGSSRTFAIMKRLMLEAGIAPLRVIECQTREMIREAVAQGLGMSLMFALECPPDTRLRVVPLATGWGGIEVDGYLAFRTEQKRTPVIRRAEAVARRIAQGGLDGGTPPTRAPQMRD